MEPQPLYTPPAMATPDAPIPEWIQELQREFPELSWQKRSWIAKVFEREARTIDRYFDGESTPDSDKIQVFRERIQAYLWAEQMVAQHRGKGSLDKSREIGKGSQPLPSPGKEVYGMEAWREQFKETVGGMVNDADEALRVKDAVMKLLVEWRGTPAPLPEENAR